MYLKIIISSFLLISLLSCTAVKPWQKGALAKEHMALDVEPLESKFMQHTYTSKEGSSGGYGIGGGGCGCN